jgi:hypothetical protein
MKCSWDFCEILTMRFLWYNIVHLWHTWNICEQRQIKSHESLIVWTRFEQRQIFVRFCSTMFHETLWNNVEQNIIKISSCGRTLTHQTSWNIMKQHIASSHIIEQNLTKISSCGRTFRCAEEPSTPGNHNTTRRMDLIMSTTRKVDTVPSLTVLLQQQDKAEVIYAIKESLPLYHMRNGSDWNSNTGPPMWQAPNPSTALLWHTSSSMMNFQQLCSTSV